ncbi:LamG domain-containing protein [Candidatus Poribacteria bacterium]|nr:LamG domain-containing protein [Candidatus Poribacteria bacterium]
MKITLIILLTLLTALMAPPAFASNRVLSLDGDGDYVEIVPNENLNAINSQATIEAWIKAEALLNGRMLIIYKGDEEKPDFSNRSYDLALLPSGCILLASAPSGEKNVWIESSSNLIKLNRWYHIAGVIDAKKNVIRMFINGVEAASREFGDSIHVSALSLRIGWTYEDDSRYSSFAGQIDEVRIWRIARSQEEIQATMHATLSGKEPGLVGYWRFDDAGKIATDSSKNH